MSANEIELTFIRCQNCKSLMPSTAVVCGMCGFQRSETDIKSKQRLRQQSDVNINDNIPQESQPILDRTEPAFSTERNIEPPKKENKESPLKRDYLNFGKKNSEPENSARFQQNSIRDIEPDESDEADLEEFEDDSEGDDDEGTGFQDKDGAVPTESNERDNDVRPKKRKRRRKKKPNLHSEGQVYSEHQGVSSTPNAFKPPINKPSTVIEEEVAYSSTHTEREIEHKGANRVPDQSYSSPRQDTLRHEIPRQVDPKKEEEVRVNQAKQPAETRMEHKVRNEEVDGKLLGWLINYSTNSKGSAFELRVGRRFIGRQALRQDDLIIQDSALSTPHSLLHVEKGQIFIQDLMSENGTFVKSSNSNEFIRKDSSTKLAHGDVIRLGSYELIVCLVPNH